jgi:osmoprotectant transport system ATP-binding protein
VNKTTSTSGVRITLENVSKSYSPNVPPAVDNFSMDINPGEFIMLVGPSGCGKTTTMKMINRIIEPTSGKIIIDGQDVLSLNPSFLRRNIGYVIQQIGLFPHMTIADNIAVVPTLLGWSKEKTAARVEELLALVELDGGSFAKRYPKELSGGQQQRVGVARALAADPPVMLMDEPFGATDPITREKLQLEFLRLQESMGKTIVFVTHDFDEALKLGDRIAVLGSGSQIVQFDTPANILANPANEYVSSFIGQGAALKSLALIAVEQAKLLPASAATSSLHSVGTFDNLRTALDRVVLAGGHPVPVLDLAERVVGAIGINEISDALGVDVQSLSPEKAL